MDFYLVRKFFHVLIFTGIRNENISLINQILFVQMIDSEIFRTSLFVFLRELKIFTVYVPLVYFSKNNYSLLHSIGYNGSESNSTLETTLCS